MCFGRWWTKNDRTGASESNGKAGFAKYSIWWILNSHSKVLMSFTHCKVACRIINPSVANFLLWRYFIPNLSSKKIFLKRVARPVVLTYLPPLSNCSLLPALLTLNKWFGHNTLSFKTFKSCRARNGSRPPGNLLTPHWGDVPPVKNNWTRPMVGKLRFAHMFCEALLLNSNISN